VALVVLDRGFGFVKWIVAFLALLNLVLLVWSGLEYSHARKVATLNSQAVTEDARMPGMKLQLLRERVPTGGGQEGAANEVQAQEKTTAAQSEDLEPLAGENEPENSVQFNMCLLLGPISDEKQGDMIADRLSALQIRSELAGVEIAGEPDYWVYLKAEPTRELAIAKLKELQDKRIDSFIIPKGELVNGISLGVFDRQENAQERQNEVQALGYDARLHINHRKYIEEWVVLRPDEAEKFNHQLYQQLKSDFDALDMRRELCEKVAPLERIP